MIRGNFAIAGLCLTTAAVAFVATLAAKSRGPSTSSLNMSEREWNRATACDPAFRDEARTLAQTLDDERAALADLLDQPGATDEQVRAQVERVIVAHNALERRAAEHLLKVREQLSPSQQKQLMGLVSETVRHAGPRWRGGRGEAPATQPSSHPGRRGQRGSR
jgi:hypothetical protein